MDKIAGKKSKLFDNLFGKTKSKSLALIIRKGETPAKKIPLKGVKAQFRALKDTDVNHTSNKSYPFTISPKKLFSRLEKGKAIRKAVTVASGVRAPIKEVKPWVANLNIPKTLRGEFEPVRVGGRAYYRDRAKVTEKMEKNLMKIIKNKGIKPKEVTPKMIAKAFPKNMKTDAFRRFTRSEE